MMLRAKPIPDSFSVPASVLRSAFGRPQEYRRRHLARASSSAYARDVLIDLCERYLNFEPRRRSPPRGGRFSGGLRTTPFPNIPNHMRQRTTFASIVDTIADGHGANDGIKLQSPGPPVRAARNQLLFTLQWRRRRNACDSAGAVPGSSTKSRLMVASISAVRLRRSGLCLRWCRFRDSKVVLVLLVGYLALPGFDLDC